MSSCAYEFAEDGSNDTVAAPDGSGFIPAVPLAADLPMPAGSGRADFRGMFPNDTVFALDKEAAAGTGARVFANQPANSGGIFWLLAIAGSLYFATRN